MTSPKIFLSYNHEDGEHASRLRRALEVRGVEVHIDYEAMRAGEEIRAFIERSIQKTDATVCLVSNRSLSSAWVAIETIDAFYAERFASSRPFIACHIDDDFFRPRFRLEVTDRLDAKIAEIDGLMAEYVERRLDTNDLNDNKSRLYQLRNNLGEILRHLRNSLTLDVRGEAFEPSVDRIVETLTLTVVTTAAGADDVPEAVPTLADAVAIDWAQLASLRSFWAAKLWMNQEDDGGFRSEMFEGEGFAQTWTTAQAVVALTRSGEAEGQLERIAAALDFVERDCSTKGTEGWTYITDSGEEGITEIAAWVTVAHVAALEAGVGPAGSDLGIRLEERITRDVELILRRQHESGGFSPVGHVSKENTMTYSTAMALWALTAARRLRADPGIDDAITRGLGWLWDTYSGELGWVANPRRSRRRRRNLGLEAQVLATLLEMGPELAGTAASILLDRNPAFARAKTEFLAQEDLEERDFGENDRLDDIDQFVDVTSGSKYRIEGSTYLWCPWAARAMDRLRRDATLKEGDRARAHALLHRLVSRVGEAQETLGYGGTWEVAETLLCLASIREDGDAGSQVG